MTTRFPDSEFQAASHRGLTAVERTRAEQFRHLWLESARDALAFPIRITSFVRAVPGMVGTHGGGYALDVQPCRSCGGQAITNETFGRRLDALYQWIAINRPRSFGTLIHERDHLHVTLPGFQDRFGVVLREPTEGVYVPESLRPIMSVAPVVLALGALVLFTRS